MIKKILLLMTILALQSCATTKKSGDEWVGESSRNLIKKYGPPVRTVDNAEKGEILIYADQIYTNSHDSDSRIAGPNYWNYEYIYVNKEGKIYSLRNEKQNYPPQAIDSPKNDRSEFAHF